MHWFDRLFFEGRQRQPTLVKPWYGTSGDYAAHIKDIGLHRITYKGEHGMVYKIDGKEIEAEQVTQQNLEQAKRFDGSAEVGDYCITLPDRTVGVVDKAVFEQLVNS